MKESATKYVQMFLAILILLPSLTLAYWQNEIYVNASLPEAERCQPTRNNNILECPTLNLALQAMMNSTVIYLYDSTYILEHGVETEIRNKSQVAIIGLSESTRIECRAMNIGLSFVHTNDITLKSFIFSGCWQTRNSTSRNYTIGVPFGYLEYRVSVYILLCMYITMENITVTSSGGTGMTLYNCGGSVHISNCKFLKNYPYHYGAGGGGLQIEFSFCVPGDLSCKDKPLSQIDQKYSSNANYTIQKCQFHLNVGYRGYSGLRKLTNIGQDTFSFGHGGGISIIFKGNASMNTLVLQGAEIIRNVAHMGAGFYVSFHDTSSHNKVLIEDSVIQRNKVFEKDIGHLDVDGGGGGGKIIFDDGDEGTSYNNAVVIRRCNFSNNTAISGGGLWIETIFNKQMQNDSVTVEKSQFVNNSAYLASGVYLSSGFKKPTIQMRFTDIDFLLNIPVCFNRSIPYSFLPCSGIIYSVNIPFLINGSCNFLNNYASAIELHEADIEILENSTILFQGNTSPYGPALAVYDCSYITLADSTTLVFTGNRALINGGAIYAGSCSGGSQPADASSECFVQYYKKRTHPNQWNVSLQFINNTDETGPNALFAVSMSACWYPVENKTLIQPNDFNSTFCWKGWTYENDGCTGLVHSGPVFVFFTTKKFNIRPGEAIILPQVRDGSYAVIDPNNLEACVAYGPASFKSNKSCLKSHHKDLNLYYKGTKDSFYKNHTIHINIKLTESGPGGVFEPSFDLQFETCVWPYEFSGSQCSYKVDYFCCGDEGCGTKCGIGSVVTPKPQYCVSSPKQDVVAGHCPFIYNGRPVYKPRDKNISLSDCSNGHSGALCGGCEDNLGVPVNSLYYRCVQCSKFHFSGVLLFVIFQLFPLTIAIVLIIIFNINLTTGAMIGFVFYCQIISLNFPVWYYPNWFTFPSAPHSNVHSSITLNRLVTVPYRIFSLDFMTAYDPAHSFPICISSHMEPMGVIAFSYVTPLYCITLLLFLTGWLVMYERGIKCVVYITRPFHRCLARFWSRFNISPSLIESIASIYILCFTPLAATSFTLLHFTTWQSLLDKEKNGKAFFYNANIEYFGYPHAFLGLLAIFVLVIFCILPTAFLIFFPFRWFHKLLDRMKLRRQVLIVVADIVTGSLHDGSKRSKDFRYFAGLYLFLRLLIMCFYYIPGQNSVVILFLEEATSLIFGGIIMIFRPFKKTLVNFANFMIFALLGLMSVLCLRLSHKGALINLVLLMHLPMIVAVFYLIYHLSRKMSAFCRNRQLNSASSYSTSDVSSVQVENEGETSKYDDEDLPDRLKNPNDYVGPTLLTRTTMRERMPSFATVPLINAATSQRPGFYGSTR